MQCGFVEFFFAVQKTAQWTPSPVCNHPDPRASLWECACAAGPAAARDCLASPQTSPGVVLPRAACLRACVCACLRTVWRKPDDTQHKAARGARVRGRQGRHAVCNSDRSLGRAALGLSPL
jgi:hypothetical protein